VNAAITYPLRHCPKPVKVSVPFIIGVADSPEPDMLSALRRLDHDRQNGEKKNLYFVASRVLCFSVHKFPSMYESVLILQGSGTARVALLSE
jgi:hypothetical protein